MERNIAHLIAYLFHPLLMPTYGLISFFQIESLVTHRIPFQAKLVITLIVFLNTALLPSLIFVFMKYKNIISSLKMENRTERFIPFMITAIFYFSTYYFFQKHYLPQPLNYIIFGSACLILLALIINFWWKISIHMIAVGALCGSFICISVFLQANLIFLIVLFFIVAGLIGFSRLKLEAHTPSQVYGGFLTGLFFMIFLFII